MASLAQSMNDEERRIIATNLGEFIQAYAAFSQSRTNSSRVYSLGESFPYCIVRLNETRTSTGTFDFTVWLHIIHLDGELPAWAFSRAKKEGSTNQDNIASLSFGALASKIEMTASWLELHEPDDESKVWMLAFPAYHTTAFGLEKHGLFFAVLIDQPNDFTRLRTETIYPLTEFLELLTEGTHSHGIASA